MRFENDGISLWFGTPDAPGPGDTIHPNTEVTITIAVQPGDRSNTVEVLYRVNKGSDEVANARWLRNDAKANVQYFRASLPPRSAGDIVEYIPICQRPGRKAPSEVDIQRTRSSFRIADLAIEARSNARHSETGPIGAAAARVRATTSSDGNTGRVGPVPGKLPPDINKILGGKAIPGAAGPAFDRGLGSPIASGRSEAPNDPASDPRYQIRFNTLNAILPADADKEGIKSAFSGGQGGFDGRPGEFEGNAH